MARLAISAFLVSISLQVALPASAVAARGSAPAVSLRIDPNEIGVNLLYSGATVRVEGSIPAGYDAAILCRGKERTVELKRKGKVMRLLWMNVADVVFEDVPSLYLLSTSGPLTDLARPSVLRNLGLGYLALMSKAVRSIEQPGNLGDFQEFVKLKESEKLYSYDEGGLRLEPGPDGAMRLSVVFPLPTKAPWGEYEVQLFGFKARRGELLRTERFQVAPAGLTARISTLAVQHGLLYGILAVLIALGVGLLTGLAFGLASKKGH